MKNGYQAELTDLNAAHLVNIFGQFDVFLKKIERELKTDIIFREEKLKIKAEDRENLDAAKDVINELMQLSLKGNVIDEQNVNYAISLAREKRINLMEEIDRDIICHTIQGKSVKPKTAGQKAYVDAIRDNMIVFGIGPAGTGKTYLAVAAAVKALRAHEVSRIILTRPAVEAGERLGFLPGDLQSKIDPYLRPLYDALYEMLGAESCQKLIEKMTIEIAPLAYMRGRTLDDSFIILDEAQNTTPEQMKMFLTRLGNGSKAVVTGDLTQTDLPRGTRSGLSVAGQILKNIEDIGIHQFTERDVVRHRLVQKIIMAYEKYDHERAVRANEQREHKQYRPSRG